MTRRRSIRRRSPTGFRSTSTSAASARDSAPDLLALLDQSDARPGPDHERRADRAPVHAGHGDQGRREDVEVEGQRGRAPTTWWSSTAPIPAALFVLFAAPPEKDMDWNDRAWRAPYRFLEPRLPLRHAQRGPRAASRRARGRPQGAAQAAPDHPQDHRGLRQSLALQYLDRGADGVDQRALRRRSRTCRARRWIRSCRSSRCCCGPFAPYLAEEMWEELGRTGPVFRQPWPAFDRGTRQGRRRRDRGAGERQTARPIVGAVRTPRR